MRHGCMDLHWRQWHIQYSVIVLLSLLLLGVNCNHFIRMCCWQFFMLWSPLRGIIVRHRRNPSYLRSGLIWLDMRFYNYCGMTPANTTFFATDNRFFEKYRCNNGIYKHLLDKGFFSIEYNSHLHQEKDQQQW